jgi:biotin synthase
MKTGIRDILERDIFSRNDILQLLKAEEDDKEELFANAAVKEKFIGKKVWLRGLIEFSNVCSKNCLYCGIRKGNRNLRRYNLTDDEILNAAKYAWEKGYGSIALQSGELESERIASRIERLLHSIKNLSGGNLGITLSVGEQEPEIYRRWYEAGAHRYLLRIEATNPELYRKLHPDNSKHSYQRRLECLKSLQDTGYMTGTGVMIGLPFQTYDDLAGDLLYMKEFDIDMCGMGPYIEHADTPLIKHAGELLPLPERLDLTLKMIAVLRIMMKDINIVAATALQAIDQSGREKAVRIGANIIMPNITPGKYRDSYKLYNNKPCTDEAEDDCRECLETSIRLAGSRIIYNEWGDSKHYNERISRRSK